MSDIKLRAIKNEMMEWSASRAGHTKTAQEEAARVSISLWAEEINRLLPEAGGGWDENIEYLLARCPHAIRCREGGGPESLINSLILTFTKMEMVIEKLKKNGPV